MLGLALNIWLSVVTGVYEIPATGFIQMDDGFYLLQDDGSKLLLGG